MTGNPELIEHYRRTHARRVYGTSSVKYVRYLRPEIRLLSPASILDYGCGQSLFLEALELPADVSLLRYDPAIPQFAAKPAARADLLVNIDVLEHVDEPDVDDVLADMRRLSRNAIIIVDTLPAKHTLPDGRNAHVTVRPASWWRERIGRHFGPLEPVATPRTSRAGFKTWRRPAGQSALFWRLNALETVLHATRRLANRHKSLWKVSATNRRDEH